MPPIATPADLLDPTALARFGQLELLARLVVEGVMAGLHKSPFKGVSVEFAEHRQYGPGDEIKHIDWRAFGKTDRYYVKEYEEETNLQAFLVVDTSASMAYAGRNLSKFEYARRMAAALAYLMINQRDAVGLVTSDPNPAAIIPPRTAPNHFGVLCQALEATQIFGETPLHTVLDRLAPRLRRRGLVVILSDAFDQIDRLTLALRHLRHRHHEVLLFQVVAPEEETFDLRGPLRLRDLESPETLIPVDPQSLRRAYIERFEAHGRALRDQCRAMAADYVRVNTAQPPDRILLGYLASRGRSGGNGR